MLGRRSPPINADLSSTAMLSSPPDLAQVRLDNALRLFEEFVRATARHADAATLRGLERRFAERLQIQPSYWSQIKSRSRQIGERLARQFEQRCHKPAGWMDLPPGSPPGMHAPGAGEHAPSAGAAAGVADAPAVRSGMPVAPPAGAPDLPEERLPMDDDERFIVGLVLTYYRRHPQRARARLLDLLGEVLIPGSATAGPTSGGPAAPAAAGARPAGPPGSAAAEPAENAQALWQRAQAGVAPLRKKR
jgi:hypothetical protein